MNISRIKATFVMLFLTFILSGVSLSAQTGKTVTINRDRITIKEALASVEKQTEMSVAYNESALGAEKTIALRLENAPLEKGLDEILKGTGFTWTIEDGYIIISPEKKEKEPHAISGTVMDENGQPMIGVGVLVKGGQGTITDIDGKYTLEVKEGDAVEFSFLGYVSQNINISKQTIYDVKLLPDTQLLDEVVVTALGIKRKEKALSYNVKEVDSEDLLAVKDANFVNSLNGKVAGLVINASSSGLGGATKVVMRGQKSISKSSNALYVIDGIPMYTRSREAGTEFDSRGATDPIADINPEDIESMTVLTGAAAAALYGSEAANGAIVINTKKGEEGKFKLSFSSNTEVFTPFVLPEFQNVYGTGDYSSSERSVSRSWGARLNETNYRGYDPGKDYFQTGITGTESLSISTGNSRNQSYVSLAAVNSKGNVPNNIYSRYNFTFRNTSVFLEEKMHLDLSASVVMQSDRNMTNQGTYNNPLVGAYLFPRGDDWNDVSMFERWDPVRKINTQYWPAGDAGITMQNPYWINYRNLRENNKKRYMFNAGLSYEIFDWMTLSGRVRYDSSFNEFTEKFYASTNQQLTLKSNNGLYGIETIEDRQFYGDILLDIDKQWNLLTLHVNLGASITDILSDKLKVRGPIADGMVDPDEKANIPNKFNVFALSQSRTVKAQDGWREQTQSVYGSAELGYAGAYFLTLTGRNDWPSQLAGPRSLYKSFFYPSVGGSVILSEIFTMPRFVDYLKIRTSYASVGSAFDRYVANPLHLYPEGGSDWEIETSYPMDRLKPERTSSWEVGFTFKGLQWFDIDFTYYNTHTKNQTFFPEISAGSGYSKIPIQSGDVLNEGIELSVGFDKQWGNFGWTSNYSFSTNRNEIISLADDAINPVTGEVLNISSLNMGGLGNVKFLLKEGGSLGDIYSRQRLQMDRNNDIFVDNNGKIYTEQIQYSEDYIKLGSVLPKANMSWNNRFTFSDFSFSFLLAMRLGGVVYSRTQAYLDSFGVSAASAAARDKGGVLINGTDIIDANAWYSTIGSGDTVPQYYTYSATNLRLQEVVLGYTFSRKKLNGICDLTLQLVGRNLLMIYNKAPFDPENIATTGNYYQGIDYFMTPGTRNVGFNIRLNF